MSGVFWLGGFSLQRGLDEGLRALGVKKAWLQEIHRLGDTPELPFELCYRWPGQPTEAHRLLHFACQALQSSDLHLLLLAGGTQAAVLASPQVVGRWNLSPRASLSERFSYPPETVPEQFLAALALQLSAVEIDPEQPGFASVMEGAEFPLAPAFPAVQWLKNGDGNFLAGLNLLCSALEERPAVLGLLFTPGLATVVERL